MSTTGTIYSAFDMIGINVKKDGEKADSAGDTSEEYESDKSSEKSVRLEIQEKQQPIEQTYKQPETQQKPVVFLSPIINQTQQSNIGNECMRRLMIDKIYHNMDKLEKGTKRSYKALDRSFISQQKYEHLKELNDELQIQVDKMKFSVIMKAASKGIAGVLENYFDGSHNLPLTSYAPILTNWSSEASEVIEENDIMFDNISSKIIETLILLDGFKLATGLVSSAIIRDQLNHMQPGDKTARNIQYLDKK